MSTWQQYETLLRLLFNKDSCLHPSQADLIPILYIVPFWPWTSLVTMMEKQNWTQVLRHKPQQRCMFGYFCRSSFFGLCIQLAVAQPSFQRLSQMHCGMLWERANIPSNWIFCPIVPECKRVQISSKVSVVECVHWAVWSCDVTEPARLHGVNPEWPETLDKNHTHSLKTVLACVVKPTFKACFFSPSSQKSYGGRFGFEPPFIDGIKQFILNHKIWFQSGQSAF